MYILRHILNEFFTDGFPSCGLGAVTVPNLNDQQLDTSFVCSADYNIELRMIHGLEHSSIRAAADNDCDDSFSVTTVY